jgi:hypothetical protein
MRSKRITITSLASYAIDLQFGCAIPPDRKMWERKIKCVKDKFYFPLPHFPERKKEICLPSCQQYLRQPTPKAPPIYSQSLDKWKGEKPNSIDSCVGVVFGRLDQGDCGRRNRRNSRKIAQLKAFARPRVQHLVEMLTYHPIAQPSLRGSDPPKSAPVFGSIMIA